MDILINTNQADLPAPAGGSVDSVWPGNAVQNPGTLPVPTWFSVHGYTRYIVIDIQREVSS